MDNAWDEAAALVLGVTGLADAETSLEELVDVEALLRIEQLAQRRIRERQPLAYLLGEAPYCGLRFLIEPRVVVPRSPIGPLLLDGLHPWLQGAPTRILDLCCGCGALGLLAARRFAAAQVVLVDADPWVVTLAERNAAKLGLSHRVRAVCADLYDGVQGGAFDLILCNPPYVDAADMAALPPEFACEPAFGLAGGEDGLAVIRRVLADAGDHLTANGLLVCEAGMSGWRVRRAWPKLPCVWPDLPAGGTGVFVLEAAALRSLLLP